MDRQLKIRPAPVHEDAKTTAIGEKVEFAITGVTSVLFIPSCHEMSLLLKYIYSESMEE